MRRMFIDRRHLIDPPPRHRKLPGHLAPASLRLEAAATKNTARIRQFILALILVGAISTSTRAQNDSPTVGAPGRIDQIILSGSELQAKPIVDQAPMVVRVVKVFPHGDSFRYDLVFHGLEPGRYDLSRWLVRKDGSSTDDLPEIPVEIKSLLPPGQIEPNELETGWFPRLGGYRNVMIAAIVLWTAVLLGLIFMGRKKPEQEQAAEKSLTLADLLQPRLKAAANNEMSKEQYAELERMLFAFWRQRLNIQSDDAATALAAIHEDAQAGPLMRQLEQWMHSPHPDKDVDLPKLLEPYRNLPADSPGFDS